MKHILMKVASSVYEKCCQEELLLSFPVPSYSEVRVRELPQERFTPLVAHVW